MAVEIIFVEVAAKFIYLTFKIKKKLILIAEVRSFLDTDDG